MYYCTTNPIQK